MFSLKMGWTSNKSTFVRMHQAERRISPEHNRINAVRRCYPFYPVSVEETPSNKGLEDAAPKPEYMRALDSLA